MVRHPRLRKTIRSVAVSLLPLLRFQEESSDSDNSPLNSDKLPAPKIARATLSFLMRSYYGAIKDNPGNSPSLLSAGAVFVLLEKFQSSLSKTCRPVLSRHTPYSQTIMLDTHHCPNPSVSDAHMKHARALAWFPSLSSFLPWRIATWHQCQAQRETTSSVGSEPGRKGKHDK